MLNELIILIAGPVAAAVSAGITALVNFVKSKLNAKTLSKVEEIAETVERLYDGLPAETKLNAFKEICKKVGINVEKATEYLETKIIPISKNLNTYSAAAEKSDENTDIQPTN